MPEEENKDEGENFHLHCMHFIAGPWGSRPAFCGWGWGWGVHVYGTLCARPQVDPTPPALSTHTVFVLERHPWVSRQVAPKPYGVGSPGGIVGVEVGGASPSEFLPP